MEGAAAMTAAGAGSMTVGSSRDATLIGGGGAASAGPASLLVIATMVGETTAGWSAAARSWSAGPCSRGRSPKPTIATSAAARTIVVRVARRANVQRREWLRNRTTPTGTIARESLTMSVLGRY